MITIDEVQRWADWINRGGTFNPQSVEAHDLVDLALSQHEEIERLNEEAERYRSELIDKAFRHLDSLKELQLEIERLRIQSRA